MLLTPVPAPLPVGAASSFRLDAAERPGPDHPSGVGRTQYRRSKIGVTLRAALLNGAAAAGSESLQAEAEAGIVAVIGSSDDRPCARRIALQPTGNTSRSQRHGSNR